MSDLQKERKIPVFTVWKNNTILKNIFLINNIRQNVDDFRQFEETLLVGRHPDCDIRVEHPSISRFHFIIHSLPSSNLLFITDLSSVHGTWVSGERIEPNIRLKVKEGDDLRIGESSRVYKLHWIPLSQAYDVSKPFVPPLNFPDLQEDEDEIIEDNISAQLKDEKVRRVDDISDDISKGLGCLELCDNDEMVAQILVPQALSLQPQNSFAVKDEANELADSDFEGLESLDDISIELGQKEMILALPVRNVDFENEDVQSVDSIFESLVPLFMGESEEWVGQQEIGFSSSTEEDRLLSCEDTEIASLVLEGLDALLLDENSELLAKKPTLSAPLVLEDMELLTPAPLVLEDMELLTPQNLDNITTKERLELQSELLGNEKQIPMHEDVQDSAWSFWYGSLVAPPATVGGLLDTESHHLRVGNESPQQELESLEITEKEIFVTTNVDRNSPAKVNQEAEPWSFWSGKMGLESVCSAPSDAEPFSESENKSLISGYLSSLLSSGKRQTGTPLITSEQKSARSLWSRERKLASIYSSLSFGDCFQSPKPLSSVKGIFESPLLTSDRNPMDSIWSRRGNMASAPQVLTSRTEEKKTKMDRKNIKHEPMSRALFHGMDDQDEEEAFTLDKENFTPSTHKSMRKLSSGISPLLKKSCSPNNYCDDIISPLTDNENYFPRNQQKQNSGRRASAKQVQSACLKERKGQSLLDSLEKSITECGANTVTCKEKCIKEGICQWNMIVDTTTLLNKESRKALQLLEGLKGTQLIIPRTVITELASLKQQVSFFRRKTEVLSALEWIEDCMVKTQWWIHVQNSMVEGRPVAPTPPASPHSQCSCGSACAYTFSGLVSPSEPLSPTVGDDILDYALSFKKNNTDGHLVLLSNDITMKITAISEGMISETAEEFRESLVNPFSERFRWTDSWPRGQTWSCADDIVLKEKFYPSSLRMSPKAMENVKGLKLILLHDSRYYWASV